MLTRYRKGFLNMRKKAISWSDVVWKHDLHCEYPYDAAHPWDMTPCKQDGCNCEDCPWSKNVPTPVLKEV